MSIMATVAHLSYCWTLVMYDVDVEVICPGSITSALCYYGMCRLAVRTGSSRPYTIAFAATGLMNPMRGLSTPQDLQVDCLRTINKKHIALIHYSLSRGMCTGVWHRRRYRRIVKCFNIPPSAKWPTSALLFVTYILINISFETSVHMCNGCLLLLPRDWDFKSTSGVGEYRWKWGDNNLGGVNGAGRAAAWGLKGRSWV